MSEAFHMFDATFCDTSRLGSAAACSPPARDCHCWQAAAAVRPDASSNAAGRAAHRLRVGA